MNAFLTGSRVYGTPTEESDVDLVVQMTATEMDKLGWFAEEAFGFDEYGCGRSFRFGKLNVIAISGDKLFQLWKESTEACEAIKPVNKVEAKAIFQKREIAFKAANVGPGA